MDTQHDDRPAASTSHTGTMRAVVQARYGEADDVLRLADRARPEVGPRDVLVKVHAAGLDRGVWHLMAGLPYPVRLAGYGVRAPKNPVPGMDVAGRVEEVGSEVTRFTVGDEVYGLGRGTFAEYAAAREDKLSAAPKGLTNEQAAAVPVSALTALQAVRDRAGVQPGQSVLVIGASGGVGTFAVQIAKAFGAEVTGVCSGPKVDLVRGLGADHALDYAVDDITDGSRRYDAILDTGGNTSLGRLRRILAPRGALVIIGAETGGKLLGGTDRQLRAMALSPFLRQRLGTFVSSANPEDLAALTALIESGSLTPVVDRTYPLDEVPVAMRYLQEGRARGKVVIRVAA